MNSTLHFKHSRIAALVVALALTALTCPASAQATSSDESPPAAKADPAPDAETYREDATNKALAEQIRVSELDRERARYSQLGLGGPITLMSVSFTLAIPVVLLGLVINALGDNPAMLVAGIGLGLVGVGSASWLGHRLRDRRVVGARIRALESGEIGRVSLGIRMRPENAGISLKMKF